MNRKKGAKLKERTELLYGIQPVLGALQHNKRLLNQLYLKKDADSSKRLREIRLLAEENKAPCERSSSFSIDGNVSGCRSSGRGLTLRLFAVYQHA